METGRVYWIAKPRVGMTEITGLGDVQRFYMVLSPGGDRAESPNRLVIIGGQNIKGCETGCKRCFSSALASGSQLLQVKSIAHCALVRLGQLQLHACIRVHSYSVFLCLVHGACLVMMDRMISQLLTCAQSAAGIS